MKGVLMGLIFKDDRKESEILLRWWQSLLEDKGARAELRRCHELTEIFMQPAFYRLFNSLKNFGDIFEDGLAVVAGLLSHVKKTIPTIKISAQMSQGEKPVISDLRFRKLLKIQNHSELYPAMIRIIKHLDGTVNIIDLSNSVYFWNDRTKKESAFNYYKNIQ